MVKCTAAIVFGIVTKSFSYKNMKRINYPSVTGLATFLSNSGHAFYLYSLILSFLFFRIDCIHATGTIGELTFGRRLEHLKRFVQFYYLSQDTKSNRDRLLHV